MQHGPMSFLPDRRQTIPMRGASYKNTAGNFQTVQLLKEIEDIEQLNAPSDSGLDPPLSRMPPGQWEERGGV